MKETLPQKHIALDFDNTLAHFEGGREGIFKLFQKQNIPLELTASLYEETKKEGGFNIDKLIKKVIDKGGVAVDGKKIKEEFALWLSRSMKLYLDASDLLLKIRKTGTSFSIISVGDRAFQEEKARALGILPHHVHVVEKIGDKSRVLMDMLEKDSTPIIYIDDKASELDAIKQAISSKLISTIRIIRPDSPYKDERARYEHREISSLGEIEI